MRRSKLLYSKMIIIFSMVLMLAVYVIPSMEVVPVKSMACGATCIEQENVCFCVIGLLKSVSEEAAAITRMSSDTESLDVIRKKGNHIFSFFIYIFVFAQMYFSSTFVEQLIMRSDNIKRFFVTLFLHLSDGKKAALSF